ncbi:phage baseplate protein, partial [Yersinia pestis]
MSTIDTLNEISRLSDRASVVNRTVGTFHFDVVTSETHASTLRLTENPIESGAAVADHAVLEPKEITLNGVMVGYEQPDFTNRLLGGRLAGMKSLPLPLNVRGITAQAENMANRYLSLAKTAVEDAPRVLAPFLPDYARSAADTSDTLDRVGKA